MNAARKAKILSAVLCACALATFGCRADCVVTIKERIEGALTLQDGQMSIGGKTIAWDSVSTISRSDAPATLKSSRVVRLKNGEIWSVEISGLVAKKMTIDSPAFGTQRLEIALIAGIDFVQNLEWDSGLAAGVLYRGKTQPIPGEIMWIDRDKISLNTSLGALTLQRDGLTRYVFSTEIKDPVDAFDEIALRDGSIFKGKAALNGTNVELIHAILGKLYFPLSALRSVVRGSPGVANIRSFSAEQVQYTPLIGVRMLPDRVQDIQSGIWGIRMWPSTVVKFPLPENHEKIVFRGALSCAANAAGHARVRVSANGKVVLEKIVSEKSEWFQLEFTKAKELEIEVDFAGKPLFPADLVLSEPQLVFE